MGLQAMRAAVARLLTDPAYQARFFADDPALHAEHGLSAEEFGALRRLDPAKLGISSEGYAGKRFERVESAFPLALRTLDRLEPDARGRYLATTAFPHDEAAERATFLAHLRAGREGRAPDAQRLLLDLADLEALLFDASRPPGLPAYRFRPERTRPRRAPWVLVLRTRGPLDRALPGLDAGLPPAYPDAPAEHLVLRKGSRVELERLDPAARALLEACDGTRVVRDLAASFGPSAEAAVSRWLGFQVVEDAEG